MKKPVPISKANRLINHGPTVLVTSASGGNDNIMTLAWNMPASGNPMRVVISVAPQRFSHGLIMESGAFAINIPTTRISRAVMLCGSLSGREVDKFERAGLTRLKAQKIPCPLVGECIGHLECKVVESWDAGDHTLFLGEVVAASADSDVFNEVLRLDEETQTLHHLGGRYFAHPMGVKELG